MLAEVVDYHRRTEAVELPWGFTTGRISDIRSGFGNPAEEASGGSAMPMHWDSRLHSSQCSSAFILSGHAHDRERESGTRTKNTELFTTPSTDRPVKLGPLIGGHWLYEMTVVAYNYSRGIIEVSVLDRIYFLAPHRGSPTVVILIGAHDRVRKLSCSTKGRSIFGKRFYDKGISS